MNPHEDHNGSQMPGTHFQVPNWSYDPSPASFSPLQNSPPPPEEVHPYSHLNSKQQLQLSLLIEPNPLSLRIPPCPQCQGKKYNFTAYFHSRIFLSPPHAIIAHIEKSYALNHQLQSLLVSYVVHREDFENANPQDVEQNISGWRRQVGELAGEVAKLGGLDTQRLLAEVMRWTNDVAMGVWQHFRGVKKFEGFESPGLRMRRMRKLVKESRKAWEKVWVAVLPSTGMGY